MADLPVPLAEAARGVAGGLARHGFRGWIVGGAVRDLARGAAPADVDMVSDAHPDAVERAFERTIAVGKAFGTIVVPWGDREVQLTTFRSESGYADARRPDEVTYGTSVEEDATRRDFTCNALYLDPLTDELRDPVGGLADLSAGRLRTVGEALERFREDGLRLLRMARFEAGLRLEPAPGLHEAARSAADALRGVSVERVLEELGRLFRGPRAAHGVGVLEACGLLERALPDWRRVAAGAHPWPEVAARRLDALGHLPDPPGVPLGLALLLEVEPLGGGGTQALADGRELARGLRASRALVAQIEELWRGRREVAAAARPGAPRSERLRTARGEAFASSLALADAWAAAAGDGEGRARLAELARWVGERTRAELWPPALLVPADLERVGVPRGPAWGRLLHAAETAQLDGEIVDRAAALRWLERARAEGG